MDRNRTEEAIKNINVVFVCQLISILIKFIFKTIFTVILGKEYVGVNGVFINILSLLSFVELGIGNAIVFRLYEPIQTDNPQKIRQYLCLYKKIYRGIAIIIFILGIFLIPFLNYIIEAPSVEENIIYIYILFLFNTCISYTFVYKKQILIADQKTYITSIVHIFVEVFANLVNICFLWIFHNYIIYLFVLILATVMDNIICTVISNKKYPYIKQKVRYVKLSSNDIHSFIEDVKGLFVGKCASTAIGSTDNIFISFFLGVSVVGIVSQYTSLIEIFTLMLIRVLGSITASLGNLCIIRKDGNYRFLIFKRIYFVNAVISGYICVGMLLLEEFFVTELWYDHSFLLPKGVTFLIIIEWYLRQMHYPSYLFRAANGHFAKLKWVMLAGAIINILLDFILIHNIGLLGIFISTIISRFLIRISDVIIICRHVFNNKMIIYYKLYVKHFCIVFILYIILNYLFEKINLSTYILFFSQTTIITVFYFLGVYVFFHKSDEWKYFFKIIQRELEKF